MIVRTLAALAALIIADVVGNALGGFGHPAALITGIVLWLLMLRQAFFGGCYEDGTCITL